MMPMDEEAQRAIQEALASDQSGAMLKQLAPRPAVPPSFDDAGSYMSPNEIAADEIAQQAQLQPITDRAAAERPSSGGFDWARALYAAGKGDLAAFDAQRERAQAREDAQVAALDQKQLARQAMDPQSEISKQRQGEYARMMTGRAQIAEQSGMGELAKTFAEEAKRASTMSATQIDRSPFGTILKESMDASKVGAQQELARQGQQYKQDMLQATIGNQQGRLGLDRAELGERIRHDMATEEHQRATENKAEVKLTKAQQEKLNQEISDLNVAVGNMEELLSTKSKVNTGPIAGPIQRQLAKFDLASDEFVNLRALGARLFNKETKTLAGTNVTPTEWGRIAPQIPEDTDDDRTYVLKMKKALDVTKQILAERKKQYQMLDGKPVDRSVTAQENAPKQTPAIVLRAKEALNDPEATPEEKAAAQRLLDKYGAK